MAYILEKVSIDSFYGNILLGLFKILDRNNRIVNVNLERSQACLPGDIVNWEQMNGVKMPKDLKKFFLSTNGFKLTWSYRFGLEILPVGSISICPLQEVILLTGYNQKSPPGISIFEQTYRLQLDVDSKVFQLSHVDEDAKVCLIYPETSSQPSIWLADEELNWHFLANRFTEYFRMSIVHLGLPYWQFCFTPQGVPAWVEQIILMDTPHLFNNKPYDINAKRSIEKEEKHYRKHGVNILDTTMFKPKDQQSNFYYHEWLKYKWKNTR